MKVPTLDAVVEIVEFGGFMKLVAGILITLAALTSNAQSNNCSMLQVELEVRHFLASKSIIETRDIKPCLAIEVQRHLTAKKMERNFDNENLAVLYIAALINQDKMMSAKQDKMAAMIKCESTGTPGCGAGDADESVLENEADLKNQGVEQERDNGTRDW